MTFHASPAKRVQAISFIPFDAVGREHDRGTDRVAAETVTPIAGELVVRHKAVPAGDLDATPLVTLKDTVTDDEKPNTQEMHAVSREPFDLAIVDNNGVLLRTILLRIVQENPVNGFLGPSPPLQEKPVEMHAESTGNIEHAIRLIGVQEQHGACVATVSPLGLRQHGRVWVNFQVMTKIPPSREIDRSTDGASCIQRLLIASESGVLPSPFAPNSRTLKMEAVRMPFCSAAPAEITPVRPAIPRRVVPARNSRLLICM